MPCLCHLLGLVYLLAAVPAALPRDGVPPLPRQDERNQLKAATIAVRTHWEKMLAKELRLRQQGASSEAYVNFARERLALARHDLAVVEEDPAAAGEQLAIVLGVREAELRRVQKLSPTAAASAGEIGYAQLRLASVRYHMAKLDGDAPEVVRQLRITIELGMNEAKRLQRLAPKGAASATQLSVVRGQIAYGRYRLAHEEGRSEDALAELGVLVEARAELLAQSKKLDMRRYVPPWDVDHAQALLLKARVRVAILERKPQRVFEQLRELAAVEERFWQRVRSDFFLEPDDREGWAVHIKRELALDRYRLTLGEQDLERVLDDPIGELEWLL
jgi:hypothetical protein